jgi:MFS family permease
MKNRSWTVVAVVAFALFTDYLVYGVALPLMPFAPAQAEGARRLGLLYGAYATGVLGATPCSGHLGGRMGCRPLLILGCALMAVSAGLFGLGRPFELLLVARFLQGASSSSVWTAGLALVAEHYPGRRAQMMGFALMGSTAGSLVGPILGGWLFQAGGFALPFLVAGGLAVAAGGLGCAGLPGGRPFRPGRSSVWTLLLDRSVLTAALAVALAAAGWGAVEPILPAHLARTTGTTPMAIGLMFTLATLAYGLVSPGVGWIADRCSTTRTLCFGMVCMAFTLPLLAMVKGRPLITAVLCLVSTAFAFALNPTSAALGNVVDCRGLGSYAPVFALYNVAYSFGMMGASALASAFTGTLSALRTLLWLSAAILSALPLLMAMEPKAAARPAPYPGDEP